MINGKKLIALCTSRIYDPQIHGYIVRLNEHLKREGYSLLVFTINSDIYWEEDRQATEKYVFDLISYDYIDAVIIMDERIKSHKIANKIIKESKKRDIPVVIANGHYENVSCINYDFESGFEKVVRHVIEFHKVRRPHIMAGHPDNEFSERRIEVFKRVLSENGIEYDDSMLSHGYFWADPCRVAMKELLNRKELPEAIICANDNMAITVSEELTQAGCKVPEDVIVSGFDGYDEIYFSEPKITTAACDVLMLADSTAEVLIKTIKTGEIIDEYITPVFIPNESCGCPEHTEHPQILRDWFKESFARHNDDNRVLQVITSSMQTSNGPGEIVTHMDSYKLNNAMTIVDRKCFDDGSNYFTETENLNAPKEFVLLFDSEHPKRDPTPALNADDRSVEYTEDILSPSIRDRVLELTDSGYPIIFNSLDFMNRPFGFICFFFRDYFITNYTNTLGVTNAVSMGVGGYVNIQYQRTLLYKMDEMYRHDPLTGLYNRIGFMNIFKDLRKKASNYRKPVTVIMSDLDGLKYINDNFGHAEGDASIQAVANALSQAVPPSSLSTRFGGDEVFSVIFGECDTTRIMMQIDKNLEEYNKTSGKPYKVSTSCGFTTSVLDDSFDIAHAIKEADDEMYKIKNSKYNR